MPPLLPVIYLAAGEGKRLAPLTDELPKGMIEVGEMTLAQRAIQSLRDAGAPRVVAVTGHKPRAFESQPVADLIDELRFNPRFDSANNVYSLWCVSDVVAGGCYIVNSDVLFEGEIADRLLATDQSAVLCAADHGVDDESMKVVANDGRVLLLSKEAPIDSNPEYIGLTRIDPADGPRLAKILEGFIGRGDVDVYYEDALQALAAEVPIGTVPVDGLAWIEIDDHQDLEHARNEVLDRVTA